MPRRATLRWSAACVAAGVILTSSHASAQWFSGVGDLPGGYFYSSAFDVSADGRCVTGASSASSGFFTEGFRWSREGGMSGIGNLPGGPDHSEARGISPDGRVIVGGSHGSNGYEAFRWEEGRGMIGLGDLPGGIFLSYAEDASRDGRVVVGSSRSGNVGSTSYEAFRWTAETGMVSIGFLPGGQARGSQARAVSADGRRIAGSSSSAAGGQAFLWTEGEGMRGLGFLDDHLAYSSAYGISDNGRYVVGQSDTIEDGMAVGQAFLWSAKTGMIALGDLPGGDFLSGVEGVSDDGRVAVGVGYDGQGAQAAIWMAGVGMRSVADVLREHGIDIGALGWRLRSAIGVSADGRTIVGTGTNPDGITEGWVVYIPAPSSALPLALGALLAARKRR